MFSQPKSSLPAFSQGKRDTKDRQQCTTKVAKPPRRAQLEADTSDSDSPSLPELGQHAECYDSEADDKDQAWAEKQRQGRHSDAILSCPGVSSSPKLITSGKQQKALGKRQRDSQRMQPAGLSGPEQVFPVFCETCDAELGVQDSDEIFHFYSVFPSTA
ncbi:MAG: hypothetical protein FRX49_02989 [Trebouxia sp. A1-2]|nr:MAG: hypothetical protein FRX49_02989 [Trebouxia sp. A1-2]